MDNYTETRGAHLATLFGNILNDLENIFRTEVQLFRAQIKEDVSKTRNASVLLFAGLFLILGGLILGAITLVQFLDAVTALPTWACYGITALSFLVGGVLCAMGPIRRKTKQVETKSLATVSDMAAYKLGKEGS
jgi:hypothetical protein